MHAGSDEELADLKTAYLEHEGNMEKILEDVMCSTTDDEPRFRKIISKLIKKEEVPDFEQFSNEDVKETKKRKRKVGLCSCCGLARFLGVRLVRIQV